MDFIVAFFIQMSFSLLKYFFFAGIPFLIFYKLFKVYFLKNKIQNRWAKQKHFRNEIKNSLISSFVMVLFILLILNTNAIDHSRFYFEINEFPIWYWPLSILFALLVHDTYFYWAHRLMHFPFLYKRFHLVHHKSVNPSPFASFSFHFLEAIVEGAAIIPIVFLVPMHYSSIILFSILSFSVNVYGHLGFEIAPKWFRKSILFEVINTSVHHNLHHSKFDGNYGLYTRFWDRVMGTECLDYVEKYDKIQDQRLKKKLNHSTLVVN